jgi:uncharacterized protein YebE (UPF0316 family)
LNIAAWSLIVFFGRIVDVTLQTIRINLIVRRRKFFAATVGFFEVIVFVAVIARVIQEINHNFYGVFAYGAGFAAGTLIGITISEKLSHDLVSTNIISKLTNNKIPDLLRKEGFGVTCYNGVGKDGDVQVINVVCRQSHLSKLNELAINSDPGVFITSYILGSQSGGFMYGMKKK